MLLLLIMFPAGFLLYSFVAVALILWLIFWVAPQHGQDNVLVYLGICSLAGSFTVTSCKVRDGPVCALAGQQHTCCAAAIRQRV
jgi:hypothetical protein